MRQKQKRSRIIKRYATVAITAIVIFIFVAIFVKSVILPNIKYNNAIEMMNSDNNDKAITLLENLGDYKDSKQKLIEAKVINYINKENYIMAILLLKNHSEFAQSEKYINLCQKQIKDSASDDIIDIFSNITSTNICTAY